MPSYTIEISDSTVLLDEVSMIIYGQSGIGKSTIAANMPDPFFVVMKGGGEHRPLHLVSRKIPWVSISTKSELDQLLLDLKAKGMPSLEKHEGDPTAIAQLQAWKQQGKSDAEISNAFAAMGIQRPTTALFHPKTLVIDQLTTLYNIYMSDVIRTVSRKRENMETPNLQDFGQARRRMLDFFQELNNLPGVHKVYLCLAEIDTDPQTQEQRGLPLLAGKLAQECMAFCDFIFYMFSDIVQNPQTKAISNVRRFATSVHGKWQARDSTGKLSKFIDLPDPRFDFWSHIVKEVSK